MVTGYPFTGRDQCSVEVRRDGDVMGAFAHGNGPRLSEGRFQLISQSVNLQEILVRFDILCSNTSKDLVAIKFTDKAISLTE